MTAKTTATRRASSTKQRTAKRPVGATALPANASIGMTEAPTDADLSRVLGDSKAVWDRFIVEVSNDCGVTATEWKSYSVKAGWSLRLLMGKRTLLWMAPCDGMFRVAFVLGEKAVAAVQRSELPADIVKLVDEAIVYPEGRAVRLHLRESADIATARKLAAIKRKN